MDRTLAIEILDPVMTMRTTMTPRRSTPVLLACWVTAQLFITPAWGADQPGEPVPLQGNLHIQSPGSPHPPYNSNPPTSGPHVPYLAKWGIHEVPITLELQVHNLEDGGVIIQSDCTDCAELVDRLKQLVLQYRKKGQSERAQTGMKHRSRYERLILAPYPGMGITIALTAWGRIDRLDEYDEDRIKRFVEAYAGIDHHPHAAASEEPD